MKRLLDRTSPRILMSISGLLLGTTLIFSEIGILAYIFLIPLGLGIFKRAEDGGYNTKRAYIDGFVFYMSLDIVAFHWILYFYPLDFVGLSNFESLTVILLGWVGLSMLQSVFSAFVFVIISKFLRTKIYSRYPILLAPFTAALFVINEWSQTFTWAGVPWARIGISQTSMPILMQTVSLFGSYFLTFIIVVFNILIAYAILSKNKRRMAAVLALAIFIFNFAVSAVLYIIPSHDYERDVCVATVQGNIDTKSRMLMSEIFVVYEALVRDAVSNGAELVILPEGTFPTDIDSVIKYDIGYKKIADALSDLATKLGATIVAGSFVDFENRDHNSMSVFYPDGSTFIDAYAKRNPVPFGEFLPMEKLVSMVAPVLAEINMFSAVVAGDVSSVFDSGVSDESIKVGTLICFDSIYEQNAIDSAREGAEMFIIPSNDSWFYDSRALDMHHSQNILRGVEQGKYTVNCANSGITSIVNAKGEVLSDMDIYTEGYVLDTVYASSGRTLYSYIGNLFVYLCIASVILPFAFDALAKRKK